MVIEDTFWFCLLPHARAHSRHAFHYSNFCSRLIFLKAAIVFDSLSSKEQWFDISVLFNVYFIKHKIDFSYKLNNNFLYNSHDKATESTGVPMSIKPWKRPTCTVTSYIVFTTMTITCIYIMYIRQHISISFLYGFALKQVYYFEQ